MPLPLPLPILAAAGGVAGWLVGRAARSSEAAGATEAEPGTAPAGPPSSSASGDEGLDFGYASQGLGTLPTVTPVDSGYDYGSGNYDNTEPPPPSSTTTPPPPPPPASSGNLAQLTAAYGPRPPGAVGVVDLHNTKLFKVSGGKATLVCKTCRAHAWVGNSAVYPLTGGGSVTLRRLLSSDHLGSYCLKSAGGFTAVTT